MATVGRPRTVSPPTEEMERMGQEMIDWVKNNNPLHLSEWWSIEKGFLASQWEAFIRIPEFLPYYETALFIVGKKYLDKTSNVRDSVSHRWLNLYFKDLKREEYDKLKYEADLKLKTDQNDREKQVDDIRKAIADITTDNKQVPGIKEPERSIVEIDTPVLDQGCSREEDPISS